MSGPDLEVWRLFGFIILAMVLGGLVGLDREIVQRPAGLRTHMLVAGAAAVFVGLGEMLIQGYGRGLDGGMVRSDPLRLIQAIITGVSFLGAGAIIRPLRAEENGMVEGLTTAASLLMSAAVGVTVALGQIWLAICVTGATLVTLRSVRWIEEWAGWRAPSPSSHPSSHGERSCRPGRASRGGVSGTGCASVCFWDLWPPLQHGRVLPVRSPPCPTWSSCFSWCVTSGPI